MYVQVYMYTVCYVLCVIEINVYMVNILHSCHYKNNVLITLLFYTTELLCVCSMFSMCFHFIDVFFFLLN